MDLAEFLSPLRLLRLLLLLTLGLIAIYAEAAPLGIAASAHSSPDVLICVLAYWALRRPHATPMLAVFALGLVRDLMTDVPVGAGALSLVIACEVLKSMRASIARGGILLECVTVAMAALGTVMLQWLLVVVLLVQPPYLSALGAQVLFTAAIYPLVVLVFRWALRITWDKREVMS